jgi:hypothetical protein
MIDSSPLEPSRHGTRSTATERPQGSAPYLSMFSQDAGDVAMNIDELIASLPADALPGIPP